MALTDLFTKSNGGRAPQRVYLTGDVDGRARHAARHAGVSDRVRRRPGDVPGRARSCSTTSRRSSAAAEVVTGVQFHADTMQQDAAKMAELLGKPPDYTEKGRQLASIEIQISGGPRPFAVEGLASRFLANMATSPAALVGSTTPSNRAVETTHIKYAIDDGLGLTADAINARVRRKSARRRDPQRERARTKRSCRSTARSSGRC